MSRSHFARALTLAVAMTGALALGAPPAFAGKHVLSITNDDDGGHGKIVIRTDTTDLKADWRGEFKLTDDETDIARISRGGALSIETKDDGVRKRMTFAPDGDAIARKYFVGKRERPVDAEAREWLAGALQTLLRSTGFDAEARVARFLKRGGAPAVLEEMTHLHSDYATMAYTRILTEQADLNDKELRGLMKTLSAMDGDYELSTALKAVLENEAVRPETLPAFLDTARGIDGDYEMSTLLKTILGRKLTPASMDLAVKLAEGVDGDYELSQVAKAAFANPAISDADAVKILDLAKRRIDGSYELSQVIAAAPRLGASQAVTDAAIGAADAIDGAYERQSAIVGIAKSGALANASWAKLIDAAAKIDGAYEQGEALSAIAQRLPDDPALAAAYTHAAAQIDSEYERRKAERALHARN